MAKSKKLPTFTVISVITAGIIFAAIFVLGGGFAGLSTAINKSKASQANPKVTQTFVDVFNDGSVNGEKWAVTKTDGVTVTETNADNLRFDVSAGSSNNKPHRGELTFSELIKGTGDFSAKAVVYKPVVTGDGTGITGVRFTSKGSDDDEAAVVRWEVTGSTSKASFLVVASDGTVLESEKKDVTGNVVILRLDRINSKYRAFYKLGKDLSGDVAWIALGSEQNVTLGNEGKLSVFTTNAGVANKYPKVAGRLDQVNLGWEGEDSESAYNHFSDAFANGAVGSKWTIQKRDGAQVYENNADNLIMSLTSGSVGGKVRYARIIRKEPVVPANKDFLVNASVYKPNVVGAGTGNSGLVFVSDTNVDDEAAGVRWVVSASASRLVFSVRAPDGTVTERSSETLATSVKRLSLRLGRSGDAYSAYYRIGDSDAEWKKIGGNENANFGAAGRVMLAANNMGAGGNFPRVVARFDGVGGRVAK